MVYTCYDKIYNVLGIARAPPGLPGPRAPPAWYQALPEQAQKACLVGLGLVTVLAAPIFVIQPIIERAILETVLPDLRYL